MKTGIFEKRTVIWLLSAAVILVSIWFFMNHRILNNRLDDEKVRSEALLSETLELQKSIDQFKKDLRSWQGKSEKLDQALKETGEKLASKEMQIKKLTAENASLTEIRKKYSELDDLRRKLESELSSLQMEHGQLLAENKDYMSQLQFMTTEKERLELQNALLEAMLTDNYRIEALKGRNEKLTVSARRTNTLLTSFDIPGEAGENIHFRILTPDNREIDSQDSEFASVRMFIPDNNLMASISGGSVAPIAWSRRVELSFKPDYKLTKGIYKIKVMNGDDYMGSIQVKLK
jgi:myosin heavy subunit